jgi:hypothetical protein
MVSNGDQLSVESADLLVHLPVSLATGSRNQVDPDGDLWMSVQLSVLVMKTLLGSGR